ncbi:MAG: TraB/GumN family protein [archaeon]
MLRFKNLTLIGTSHIAVQSIKEVKQVIKEVEPDVVALELDKKRLMALMSTNKPQISFRDVFKMGLWTFVINAGGAWIEEKFGRMVGVKPGTEMKTAVIEGKKVGAKLAMIDRDITITLKRLREQLTLKEKFRFVYDIFMGVVFKKGEVEKFDLTKVPSKQLIHKLVSRVKVRYPSFYNVLIDERNKYMAKRLAALILNHPEYKIVAVIGAGHEEEMVELIKRNLYM